jgi:D-galactose 1-dehydrogenase
MSKTPIAVVGIGKIARDQHLPSISRSPSFEMAAAVSRNASVDGVPNYASLEAYLPESGDIPAIAFCTPPSGRYDMASAAIAAGKHVLIEKPPGATLGEVEALAAQAAAKGVVLFATWHSRFAAAVAPAKAWLKGKTIKRAEIIWKEDVRRWHPGQAWIWQPGGFGVFDPGINALSILTEIMPDEVYVTDASLDVPENCQTPIAASVKMRGEAGYPIDMELDWLQTGPQTWDITVETDSGTLKLSMGGSVMSIDGKPVSEAPDTEYDEIYRRFAELIARGESDVDVRPQRLVGDCFFLGKRNLVEAFHD